jgi:hypothetical protein
LLRRFNYTGRKKIRRAAVSVTLSNRSGVPSFDAKFDLGALDLPGQARVYVEAYHHASYMRFDYGRVSDIRPPKDTRLTGIEGGGTAQFRLKIVDETTEHGRVMAEADGITPLNADEAAANRNSILPVKNTDLGDQIWRVDFNDPSGRPVLELNKNVERMAQVALSDDNFFALAYPAVIRQILEKVLFVEKIADTDGPEDDWRIQWLKFSCTLPGVLRPPQAEEDDDDALRRQAEWVDDTVAAFCRHYKIMERFVRAQTNGAE